jgi:periplasmic protein TonB
MSQVARFAPFGTRSEAYWAVGFALSMLFHSALLLVRSAPPDSPADGRGRRALSVAMRWTSPRQDAAPAEIASVPPAPAAAPRALPAAGPGERKAARPKVREPRRVPAPVSRSAAPQASKPAVEAPAQVPSEEVQETSGPVTEAGLRGFAETAPAARDSAAETWMEPLLAELRRLLEAHKRYPRMARRRGEEGTVVLRAVLTSRGEVRRWEIAEPSAHRTLDEAALRAAQEVRRLDAANPGSGEAEVTVVVPLRFSLRGGG